MAGVPGQVRQYLQSLSYFTSACSATLKPHYLEEWTILVGLTAGGFTSPVQVLWYFPAGLGKYCTDVLGLGLGNLGIMVKTQKGHSVEPELHECDAGIQYIKWVL